MKPISHIASLIAAAILFQTLFFKFSGAPESIYIFKTLGVEPWGRWISGFAELIAGIMILVPRTRSIGAFMCLGIISGAILSHLFILGISVQNDGGLLFVLAVVVFITSLIVILLERQQLIHYGRSLLKK